MTDYSVKVQVRAIPIIEDFSDEVRGYQVQYRIDNGHETLPWWKKIFKRNPWKDVYHCIYDSMFPLELREKSEFLYYKNTFQTLEDIARFEQVESERANKKRAEEKKRNKERKVVLY